MSAGHLGRTSFRMPRGVREVNVRSRSGRIALSGCRDGSQDASDDARWCLAMIKVCAAEKHRAFPVLASWKEAEGLASRLPLRQPSTTISLILRLYFCTFLQFARGSQRIHQAQCLQITTIPNPRPFCTISYLSTSILMARAVVLAFKPHILSKLLGDLGAMLQNGRIYCGQSYL